jgi:hypothetical protein
MEYRMFCFTVSEAELVHDGTEGLIPLPSGLFQTIYHTVETTDQVFLSRGLISFGLAHIGYVVDPSVKVHVVDICVL